METRSDILEEVLSLEREKKEILLKQKELYEKAKNISDTEDDKLGRDSYLACIHSYI